MSLNTQLSSLCVDMGIQQAAKANKHISEKNRHLMCHNVFDAIIMYQVHAADIKCNCICHENDGIFEGRFKKYDNTR